MSEGTEQGNFKSVAFGEFVPLSDSQMARELHKVHAPANTSEFRPTENKVLVLPDAVEEVTKGGIILAIETTEKEKWATTTGRIVAVSPLAFNYASPEEWAASGGAPPKAGQRIIYAKYAGLRVKSKRDGNDYVVLNDKDVCMTIED